MAVGLSVSVVINGRKRRTSVGSTDIPRGQGSATQGVVIIQKLPSIELPEQGVQFELTATLGSSSASVQGIVEPV